MEGCAWRKEGTDKKRIRWKSFDNHLIHQSGRRDSNPRPSAWKANALSTELLPQKWWAKMDSNHRRRKPADLQSAPFGHSGICPFLFFKDQRLTLHFLLRASCRIRTNDPEITNHVLWPTELKRRKLNFAAMSLMT